MKIRKIKSLTRDKLNFVSRKNYLRLDKNERVNDFTKKILNKVKLSSFDLTAYPETGKIYKYLSNYLKVTKDQLVLIPGSDFGLRICLEYFCNNKRKKIITLKPTFGMVEVYSKLNNINQIDIYYDKDFKLNYNKLLKNINKKISLIIIANPNSPTGTILTKEQMHEIISVANKYQVPVLIDEAYFGFYKYTYIKLLKKFQNLLILRTFSKGFGLAGLRAGYLVSNKKIIKELQKFRPMYEINSAACKFIEFLLKNKSIPENYIKETHKGKIYFEKELSKLSIIFLKTYANFIHIKLGQKKKKIEEALNQKKILTRKGPGVKGFEDFLRITLGPKKEMDKVLQVLKKFF
jgi:histidinol-phosphate aminotransferase